MTLTIPFPSPLSLLLCRVEEGVLYGYLGRVCLNYRKLTQRFAHSTCSVNIKYVKKKGMILESIGARGYNLVSRIHFLITKFPRPM